MPSVPPIAELTRDACASWCRRSPRTASSTSCSSNGQALWAHCSTRLHHIVRQHPFARASLQDEDVTRRLRRAHVAERPRRGRRHRAADARRAVARVRARRDRGCSSTARRAGNERAGAAGFATRIQRRSSSPHLRHGHRHYATPDAPLRHLLQARRADQAAVRVRAGVPDAGGDPLDRQELRRARHLGRDAHQHRDRRRRATSRRSGPTATSTPPS